MRCTIFAIFFLFLPRFVKPRRLEGLVRKMKTIHPHNHFFGCEPFYSGDFWSKIGLETANLPFRRLFSLALVLLMNNNRTTFDNATQPIYSSDSDHGTWNVLTISLFAYFCLSLLIALIAGVKVLRDVSARRTCPRCRENSDSWQKAREDSDHCCFVMVITLVLWPVIYLCCACYFLLQFLSRSDQVQQSIDVVNTNSLPNDDVRSDTFGNEIFVQDVSLTDVSHTTLSCVLYGPRENLIESDDDNDSVCTVKII